MHKASTQYKEIMDRPLRNRGRIQVGLGVVNQEAQGSAGVDYEDTDLTYYSTDANIFKLYDTEQSDYASLEENYMIADSSQLFVPQEGESYISDVGIVTKDLFGIIKFQFSTHYDIKGLTLYFGSAYPTRFNVITEQGTRTYENDSEKFETTDVIGDTSFIVIQPITMVGGEQRLHIHSAIMGVGLSWGNADVNSSQFTELVSPIAEECSNQKLTVTILDPTNQYDVDNPASFMNYLEIGNDLTISYGLVLDDGTTEWIDMGKLELSDWSAGNNQLKLNAVDKISMMKSKFTLSNRIYTRTAYEQALEIFNDLGYEERDYVIDEILKDIVLTNPMPEKTHRECLQLLANACRCVCYQNWEGQIVIQANYGLVLEISDLTATTNNETPWSNVSNVIYEGANTEYADLTKDYMRADGSQLFMDYGQTSFVDTVGYVSNVVADENGEFALVPKITYDLTAGYSFYSLNMKFGGNHPQTVRVKTYFNGEFVDSTDFDIDSNDVNLFNLWDRFDKMEFEFIKAYPSDRIVVKEIGYGAFTDYVLKKQNMLDTHLNGYKEEITKSVGVKIYSFTQEEDKKPKAVEDDVWYTEVINTTGTERTCENQLISNPEQAQLVAEWLASHYYNNCEYDVSYRGEPRINANDLIRCENDYVKNMQLVVLNNKLKFNGAWSGDLELRRAIKLGAYE